MGRAHQSTRRKEDGVNAYSHRPHKEPTRNWYRLGHIVWERNFGAKVGHVALRDDGTYGAFYDGCFIGMAVDLTLAQQFVESAAERS